MSRRPSYSIHAPRLAYWRTLQKKLNIHVKYGAKRSIYNTTSGREYCDK